jgi:hypothetical protein
MRWRCGGAGSLWRLLTRLASAPGPIPQLGWRYAVFAPDREPAGARESQLFLELGQIDELKSTLDLNPQPFRIQFISAASRGPSTVTEVEIQASGAGAAIVAAANIAWPPRTIGLRILDSQGREVFSRRRADRR